MSANVAKIIEVVGTSEKSWADAADQAIATAAKTVKGISGVQVQAMTGRVKKGKMVQYKTTLKVAFGIEK